MLGPIKNIRKTKDVRKVLTKAADLYEREPERWDQGEWIRTEDGMPYSDSQYFNANCRIDGICRVCLEGALLIFSRDWSAYEEAKQRVLDELKETYGSDYELLYVYNDTKGRTPLEVVEVLRAAAKR